MKILANAILILGLAAYVHAATISPHVFASGAAVGATAPDAVVLGDGSIWVAYTNGADSTGASGSSTVVRYNPDGAVLHTWSIAGSVDGLRIDPSGNVWALQNQDANSALTLIDPNTNLTMPFIYGNSYTANNNSLNRGFDDAEFPNGTVFLSQTNPAAGTDPIVMRLTSGLVSPLEVSGILNSSFTGLNLATNTMSVATITDPDSLILNPSGDLVLTGEADRMIAFIHNAGAMNQSMSFIALAGSVTGKPDDTAFPTFPTGTFYLTDTGANTVYALAASGLTPGSVFVDVGSSFGLLDTTTGNVTTLFTGVSPHGLAFAAPEPDTGLLLVAGLLFFAGLFRRKRS